MFCLFVSHSLSDSKIAHGCRWLKVFYHDSSTSSFFSSYSEALSSKTQYKYSIIGEIDSKYQFNGKYEFLLEYPGIDGYNRWRQTYNPKDNPETSGQAAIGYEGVNISFPGRFWGGLVRSTNSNTAFEGSAGHANWWFAIGCYNPEVSPNLFPGPALSDTQYITVTKVFLWVRIDHIEPIFTYKNNQIPISKIQFIIAVVLMN